MLIDVLHAFLGTRYEIFNVFKENINAIIKFKTEVGFTHAYN